MRKPYCCEASQHLYDQYYNYQQNGRGDFPVYVGRVKQRGHGIGDIFRSIWRYVFPVIKTMAPHAFRAGANIVEDVSSGNTWKDSAMKHGTSVIKQIPSVISSVVAERKNQSGSGYRRKRIAKRRRRDIFS
jgi:hypothetical protein